MMGATSAIMGGLTDPRPRIDPLAVSSWASPNPVSWRARAAATKAAAFGGRDFPFPKSGTCIFHAFDLPAQRFSLIGTLLERTSRGGTPSYPQLIRHPHVELKSLRNQSQRPLQPSGTDRDSPDLVLKLSQSQRRRRDVFQLVHLDMKWYLSSSSGLAWFASLHLTERRRGAVRVPPILYHENHSESGGAAANVPVEPTAAAHLPAPRRLLLNLSVISVPLLLRPV
ncbi:homeobox protein HMX3 [Lates japonicus]|uniref:Homeobox protein HMX3 n=1 Tax=Lates japonicus TaxID=270547 RepID=A0AAD3N2D8_LATJO|nr:homeobox protein HMX3 [Lates japonicus]